MILVRDVFYLKFGKAKEAKELTAKMREVGKKVGYNVGKVMTDLTGKSYTLVFETEFESLGEYEKLSKKVMGEKDWQETYKQVIPLVESAKREIYTVVE